MFVVLHHTGAWSDYRCKLFGVFDTEEKAEKAIDDMLIDRVKYLKINIKHLIAFEEKQDKQDKNNIKRHQKILCRIEQGKFNFKKEKEASFEILHVPLNRALRFTSNEYDYCTPSNECEKPVENEDDEEYDMDLGEFTFESEIWESDSEEESEDTDDESEDDK